MTVATGRFICFALCLQMAYNQLQSNNAPDDVYPHLYNVLHPIKVYERGGREVELRCTGKRSQGFRRHGVSWHFMPCGNAYNMTPCKTYMDDKDLSKWTILTSKSFNSTTAKLLKASEKDNGLYRCSVKNTSHPWILTTYELDIVDKAETRPEIIQNPQNQTVEAGARASFQCLILSKIEPTVKWFRKQDIGTSEPEGNIKLDNTNNNKFIYWSNGTYELMTSHVVKRSQDTYLSKLILPATSELDNGCYVCIAVNNIDFVHRGACLNVISVHQLSDEDEPLSLSWLFLIPVLLAVVPLSVWLCCLCRRNRHSKTSVNRVVQRQSANPRVEYVFQTNGQSTASTSGNNGEPV